VLIARKDEQGESAAGSDLRLAKFGGPGGRPWTRASIPITTAALMASSPDRWCSPALPATRRTSSTKDALSDAARSIDRRKVKILSRPAPISLEAMRRVGLQSTCFAPRVKTTAFYP